MWVILLEAFLALALLVGIVWWTMFAGRRGGERQAPAAALGPSRATPRAEAPSALPAAAPGAASSDATPPS